jgi:phosphoinositide-3-kinase, regulatory subunit 4
MQVFRTASVENEAVMPKAPSRLLNKSITRDVRRAGNYKYRIEELNDPPVRRPGIRSLHPLPGGDLLTGGTDLKIRYWDQARYSFTILYFCFFMVLFPLPVLVLFFYI